MQLAWSKIKIVMSRSSAMGHKKGHSNLTSGPNDWPPQHAPAKAILGFANVVFCFHLRLQLDGEWRGRRPLQKAASSDGAEASHLPPCQWSRAETILVNSVTIFIIGRKVISSWVSQQFGSQQCMTWEDRKKSFVAIFMDLEALKN